jgi:hypothetical protein
MSTFYWKVTTRCENISVCVKLQENSVTTANVNVRFMKYCFTVRQLLRIEEYDTRQHNTKILKKKWKDVSRIPDKIKLHCAPCVVHDNTIYIIGEKNEGQPSTVVISFKPLQWHTHNLQKLLMNCHYGYD